MKFTWLTYKIAIRRSLKREYQLFCVVANTHDWYKQMLLTARLERRQDRERSRL